MREILFRGRRVDNGEWIEGDLLQATAPTSRKKMTWIFHDIHGNTPVNPATIGQFTGLHDKNGKRIFEGDIVKAWMDFGPGGEERRTYPVVITPHGTSLQEWTFTEKGYLPEIICTIHDEATP